MAKVLTAAAVEKIKPKAARQEIPDARMQGLYLVVQPSGAKSWAVRYRLNGRPAKFTLGKYPRMELVHRHNRKSPIWIEDMIVCRDAQGDRGRGWRR
jgi:Arm DNA-binding domain